MKTVKRRLRRNGTGAGIKEKRGRGITFPRPRFQSPFSGFLSSGSVCCCSLRRFRQLYDGMCRTFLRAHTAVFTFFRIDDGFVILHTDGVEFTYFHALAAADTAGFAGLACDGTFICRAAGHIRQIVTRNHSDDVVRAGFFTGLAAEAVIAVYPGNAVYDAMASN